MVKSVTETSNRYISSTPPNSKLRVAEVPVRRNTTELKHINSIYIYIDHHFYFPAQVVGGFTLSDLLDKPWS